MAFGRETKAKKRKVVSVDECGEQSKKYKLSESISCEVDFKNKLKDVDTVNTGLEKFVAAAKALREGNDCPDIVSKYCSSSPECSEIFAILDSPPKKSNATQVILVFECLTQILQYVQSDNQSKLWSTADFIVQKMSLAENMQLVYNNLNSSNKSFKIRKAVQLLIAMVVLSKKAKRIVQAKFEFDNKFFPSLFKRRDRQDPEDVRSCIVLFTMSFIVDGDKDLITTMVQQRSFLQMTLTGLVHDPKEMVVDVLATLLDKVILNEDVKRVDKLRLFDVKLLMQIVALYEWEGPRGWKNDKKSFLTDVDFLEERSTVSNLVHELLLAICSPKKHGMAFLDKSFGTDSRNCNPLMNRLLHYLSTRLDNPLKMKLAANVLNFCPDQLSHFLSAWGRTLLTQGADRRTTAIEFLVETYKIQNPIPAFLSNRDMMPADVDRLVSLMSSYYLPCEGVAICINEGLRYNNLSVSHQCLVLMQVILHNASNVLSAIVTHQFPHIPAGGFVTMLSTSFSSQAMKMLPPPPTLFSCVDNILKTLSDPKKLESIGTEVDLVDHVSTVLKTLSLYQQLCPSLLSDRPTEVAHLVEAVGRLQAIVDAAMEGMEASAEVKVVLPQLDLLKLLSETDVKNLPLVQGGLLEKLLRSAHSLKEEHKEETVSLIYKVLTSLSVFCNRQDELALWIGQALSSEAEWTSFSPIEFLSNILGNVITNPQPYLDRVMEAVSDPKTKGRGKKKGLRDPAIKDILSMDVDNLDLTVPPNLVDDSSAQGEAVSFSPLTVAAMEELQSHDKDSVGASEYVSAVLVSLLHAQPHPAQYSQLVTGCWVRGQPGVRDYFDYWSNAKETRLEQMSDVSLRLLSPYSCRLLNWYMSTNVSDLDIANMEDLGNGEKQLSCLRQAILYMEHCVSPDFDLGHKLKRVKILNQVITQVFSHYVDGFKTVEMEGNGCGKKAGQGYVSHDFSWKGADKISTAVLYIISNPMIKERFLTSNGTKNALNSNDDHKLNALITKAVCDVLVACQDVKLSPRCCSVMETYLTKALDRLEVKEKDLPDCLTAIQAISCHTHLPSLHRCIATWLKSPISTFTNGNLSDTNVTQVHKGQKTKLSSFGEVFVELLDRWMKLLTLYDITEVKDKSLLLTLSSRPLHQTPASKTTQSDGANQTTVSPHPSPVLLDISDMDKLFDLLPVCTQCDPSISKLLHRLPVVGAQCSQRVFKSVILHFGSLGEERRGVVEGLVSSHQAFHQLGGEYIQEQAKTVVKHGHFGLVKAYLDKGGEGDKETIQAICQQLLSSQDILSSQDDRLWSCFHTLIDRKEGPATFQSDLFKAVTSFIPSNRSSTHFQHFSLLNAICQLLHHHDGGQTESQFLELALTFLTHLSKRSDRDTDLEDRVIGAILNSIQRGGWSLSQNFMTSSWPGFVKSVLKHLYTRHTSLEILAALLRRMFKVGSGDGDQACGGLDPAKIFQMCISHTAFLSTLMETHGPSAKDSLVNLLHTTTTLNPTCITNQLLVPLAGAYSASLSLTDQRLLAMMNVSLLAADDQDSIHQLPVLWGKAYLDHRVIAKSLGRGDKVATSAVLGEIDPHRMERTVLHFAMKRNTKEFDVCPAGALMSQPNCYDPSYLLRMFLQILSPGKKVPVRVFAEKNCLGFLLICLSSNQHHCRLMAYKCLNDFYAHLENSPCPATHEFAFILDLLNASRAKSGERIPYVIALYLSRVIKQVLDPADHMYLRIMTFLCQKPQLDLSSLPEFFKFFFAGSPQYMKERTWMLTLLRDGIRDTMDYQMYRKSSVFKHLMSFQSSCVSDKASKVIVLECIRNACSQGRAVKDLIKDHGLIPWLACVVSGLDKRLGQVDIVADLLRTVCCSVGVKDLADSIDALGFFPTGADTSRSGLGSKGKGVNDVDKGKGKESTEKIEMEVNESGFPKSTLVGLEMVVKSFNQFVDHRRGLSRLYM